MLLRLLLYGFISEKTDIAWIEKAANKILQGLARPILCGKCLEFAMDITYIPYHGKPKKDDAEIVNLFLRLTASTTW